MSKGFWISTAIPNLWILVVRKVEGMTSGQWGCRVTRALSESVKRINKLKHLVGTQVTLIEAWYFFSLKSFATSTIIPSLHLQYGSVHEILIVLYCIANNKMKGFWSNIVITCISSDVNRLLKDIKIQHMWWCYNSGLQIWFWPHSLWNNSYLILQLCIVIEQSK